MCVIFRATYAFEVQAPVQKPEEQPKRYSFDYQIQTPVVAKSPSTLEGLLAHVDKVVVQKPGKFERRCIVLCQRFSKSGI